MRRHGGPTAVGRVIGGVIGEARADQWAQAHPAPQPPDGGADRVGAGAPVLANTDSRRTAPGCPSGHAAGSFAALIGRRSSKVSSHVRQRNSYSGTGPMVAVAICLTDAVNTVVRPETEQVTQTGEPLAAHIVKTEPGENAAAKVLEARITGTPLEALCGHVWVPSRDPRQLPVCAACKEIYEMYRAMNDGLHEHPGD